jgi:nucleotide-binding universal stress UspA family protein
MLPRIETILYCTDMGQNAPYVLRYAFFLAQHLSARIVVLHVLETLSARQRALVEGYAGQGELAKLIERAHKEAAERLPKRIAAFCEQEAGGEDWQKMIADVVVEEGRAADQILRQVEATAADLVVIGAHTESPLLDSLVGSTTRKVLRDCPVPVLTVQVPEGKQELTMIEP